MRRQIGAWSLTACSLGMTRQWEIKGCGDCVCFVCADENVFYEA